MDLYLFKDTTIHSKKHYINKFYNTSRQTSVAFNG